MLIDALPFTKILQNIGKGLETKAVGAFVTFIEKRLGAEFLVNRKNIPYGRADLLPLFEIAKKLQSAGVITSFNQNFGYADEPLRYSWTVRCATPDQHMAGGMSASSDGDALVSALAESLERFIWFSDHHWLKHGERMSTKEVTRTGKSFVSPVRFAGFSAEQRAQSTRLKLTDDSVFNWIKAWSVINKEQVLAPAQIFLSGRDGQFKDEPMIRTPITTGLATWPTKEGAILRGVLEIVERDAYMITWLNQLRLPRLDLEKIASSRPSLLNLIERCRQYGLEPRAIRLATDAPTYAVCASVEDTYGNAPGITIGLKAHYDLGRAIEGALLEALRIRQNIRRRLDNDGEWQDSKNPEHIDHMERTHYWSKPGRDHKLRFLFGETQGNVQELTKVSANNDTEQLDALLSWARAKKYEVVTLSLGESRFNVSPWQVEMVTMPELQPMHQNEHYRYLSGDRLKEVPKMFGYEPLEKPYTEEPHPFA